MNHRLTPRETEVLQHLANGYSLCQAAADMGVSYSSVRCYLDRAKRRLETQTPYHTLAVALTLGLITTPQVDHSPDMPFPWKRQPIGVDIPLPPPEFIGPLKDQRKRHKSTGESPQKIY